MKKDKARPTAPSVVSGNKTQFEEAMYQRNLFLSMALNMTWQLAIVVVIPIVGGFKLDEHFKTSPLYTLIGLVVAALCVVLVLRRVVAVANERVTGVRKVKK